MMTLRADAGNAEIVVLLNQICGKLDKAIDESAEHRQKLDRRLTTLEAEDRLAGMLRIAEKLDVALGELQKRDAEAAERLTKVESERRTLKWLFSLAVSGGGLALLLHFFTIPGG